METDSAAPCRFFSPGDACRVVLDAYRTASADVTPPPGTPWVLDDGAPYATAADFADNFLSELAARLGLLALDRLGTFAPPEDRGDPWVRAHRADPEKMRRVISDRETELRQGLADFLGAEMHDLPPGENAGHNQAGRSTGDV